MNTRTLLLSLVAGGIALAGVLPMSAEARGYHHGPPAHAPAHGYRAQQGYSASPAYGRQGEYAWAQVVRVDPLIAWEDRPTHRQECWDEPVATRYERYPSRQGSDAGVVLGAIVGGVVGNQFGGGRGRVATTAAGAALGGAVVRDAQRGQYPGRPPAYGQTVYQERCRSFTEHVRQERVEGYEVTYRYGGRIYQTVTDHHPGDRIQVRVDVAPVYGYR